MINTQIFECPQCGSHKFYEPGLDTTDTSYICFGCHYEISEKKSRKLTKKWQLEELWERLQYATDKFVEAEARLDSAQRAYDGKFNEVYYSK